MMHMIGKNVLLNIFKIFIEMEVVFYNVLLIVQKS